MVVAHNMKAMNVERQLNIVMSDKAKSSEKLSSGYRINRSADDAAGLSISEKMRHQIRGLYRGAENIEEGVGYCQVADGALNEMHDMLQRMNELCIQGANGTLSDTDRGYIDDEVQLLKAEVDRICRTTKFNEEYIFRCDDVIEEKSHDVYKLTFSGRPKDLFIYNTSYDADDEYAGVAFRGRRYTWDEINPYMYDEVKHEFRKGEYGFRADDGTVLTLVCSDGAKLPQVSRLFRTGADGSGIYVNDDLVKWDKIDVNDDQYSFEYHGMRISYTRESGDSFEDMLLKMSGTVWESTYEVPVASRSMDAVFQYNTTYSFMNNTRINHYLNTYGEHYMPKYIIHAEDIDNLNDKGKIPVWDDPPTHQLGWEDFDGVWLEGTNDDGTPNKRVLKKMTWAEFGFNCGVSDWGNLSTDIWVGTSPKKTGTEDPVNYPPDAMSPGSPPGDINHSGYYNFAEYDPYNLFDFTNNSDQAENFNFRFSVINEVSKEQVMEALNNNGGTDSTNPFGDGLMVYYPLITPDDRAEVQISGNNRVTCIEKELNLSLRDEYNLGRDYENGQSNYMLKNYEQLTYNNGTFSVGYGYDSNRIGGTMTLSGSTNFDVNELKRKLITGGTINGDRLSVSNRTQSINISMSGGSSSSLTLTFNYDISDFFGANGAKITEIRDDTNGMYVRVGNKYEVYDRWSHGLNPPKYNVDITSGSVANQQLSTYFTGTVYPQIAAASQISLHTKNYPTGQLTGQELYVSAMVTRWQTPFQHPHIIPPEQPEEPPEYLRIQCSSNTTDTIWIQKQKLSAYRLGLLNVGTLSEMQATGCIDMVGKALSKISSVRSLFGAEQNRLEHAYMINRNTHENTQSAESQIRDTDMAKEMVHFSNANILEQSGNSMLVQANQANNIVLSLLQ